MQDCDTGQLPTIDLSFRPELDNVSAVREFLERYYSPLLQDQDLVGRMAVAVHELLENAAKYSKGGPSRLRVGSRGTNGATMLSVSVSNVAAREHVDGLMHTVKELGEGENTAEVYQCFLARAARRKKGSGLGLARIHAEAEMTLTVSFQGDHVCVEAVAPLPAREET